MDIEQLIKQGTFTRDYRICTTPYSLNPAIAYTMNHLAELDDRDRILDPCCGTGTILIERQLLKAAECTGVDINPKNLECAKQNIEEFYKRHPADFRARLVSLTSTRGSDITLKHGDIIGKKFPDNYFTKIISNLPYGIHSGSREANKKLYRFLADQSIDWLKPGGKAIFLTSAKSILRNSFSFNSNWTLLEEIPIKMGGLTLSIFIYQKG